MAQHSLMQVGASGRSHVHVAYLRFVRQSSFFTAHVRGSRWRPCSSSSQTRQVGCVSSLQPGTGLPAALQAVSQEQSPFCPPTTKAPEQIHTAESTSAPTEVTGHHYSSKSKWYFYPLFNFTVLHVMVLNFFYSISKVLLDVKVFSTTRLKLNTRLLFSRLQY